MTSWRTAIAGLASFVIALACGKSVKPSSQEQEDATTVTKIQPLRFGVVGCISLTPSGRCVLKERVLRLRIDAEPGTALGQTVVRIDGVVVDGEARTDSEGRTLRVDVPDGARELRVQDSSGASAMLAFVEEPERVSAIRRALLDMAKAGMTWPQVRGHADALVATLDDRRDRHAVECAMAAVAFETREWSTVAAIADSIAEGDDLDIVCPGESRIQAAYSAIYYSPNYEIAKRSLAAVRRHPIDLVTQISADQLAGGLEQRLGHYTEASGWFDRATRRAARLQLPEFVAAIAATHAMMLAELGHFARAEALADAAIAELPIGHPAATQIRSNAAWVRVLHREVDEMAPDPTPQLEALLAEYEAAGEFVLGAALRLELAIVATHAGRLSDAATHLTRLDRSRVAGPDQAWVEWVSAHVQGVRSIAVAREHLARAQLLAELHDQPVMLMRVHAARGRLEERHGELASARVAYAAADLVEDRVAQSIAPTAGRGLFGSARWRDRALQLELALRMGDPDAALCVALGARARHLRRLRVRVVERAPQHGATDSRRAQLLLEYRERMDRVSTRAAETWRLSLADLERSRIREAEEREQADALLREAVALTEGAPAPWTCAHARHEGPADTLLTMHPASEPGRWWLLLDRAGEITAKSTAIGDVASIRGFADGVAALIDSGALAGMRDLTVVPVGELVGLDVHALTLSTQPTLRVAYSLGLGVQADPIAASPSAIVIAETTNLRSVTDEAEQVATRLRGLAWTVETAWSGSGTQEAPGLLHYAGHASRGDDGGWDGWIELEGRRVTAAEIVASARAPAIVVLSACDAGASDLSSGDGGMNMAAAFLLAGAQLVVAPTRAVEDELAHDFSLALYSQFAARAQDGPPTVRMHDAFTQVVRSDLRFSAWRVWVP